MGYINNPIEECSCITQEEEKSIYEHDLDQKCQQKKTNLGQAIATLRSDLNLPK